MVHELYLNCEDADAILAFDRTFDVRKTDDNIHIGGFVHYTLTEGEYNAVSSWQPLHNVWFEVTYLKHMDIDGDICSVFAFRPSPLKSMQMSATKVSV